MIFKSYEIKKINLKKNKIILFYGDNEGFKKEAIDTLISNSKIINIDKYDETQILENNNIFLDEIFSGSLFENEKIILINKASDKLFKLIQEITDKEINDIYLIINSNSLEKKSKLRNLFEKNKNLICVPFYPDNAEALSKIAFNFFREKKISVSQSNINLLIDRSNGDRGILKNELEKIQFYTMNKKNINEETLLKLTNLIENYSISDLIDNCLAKNQKRIIHILNENNFNSDDCMLIIRSLLNKAKNLLKLSNEFKKNNNIELTISSAKPPIFWKNKEITKQQIYKWSPKSIKNFIYELNNIELLVKINFDNSVNLITDFILHQASTKINN